MISADTRESIVAAYLDNWKRRIEAVGGTALQVRRIGRCKLRSGAIEGVAGSQQGIVAGTGRGCRNLARGRTGLPAQIIHVLLYIHRRQSLLLEKGREVYPKLAPCPSRQNGGSGSRRA